jgi:hypothetical protein
MITPVAQTARRCGCDYEAAPMTISNTAHDHDRHTTTRQPPYRLLYLDAESNSHPQAHVKEELDMQPAPERHSGAPYNEIGVDLHMLSTYSLQYIQYMQCIQYKRCRQYAQDTQCLQYIQYMQCKCSSGTDA